MAKAAILNTGAKMPMIGLGTWKSKPGEVKAAVEAAIECGYRHIDCAYLYQNESEVGEGIATKIKEGKVTRQDLFVTSKVWCTHFRRVRESCEKSLANLKLKYLDLFLVHEPHGLKFKSHDDLFPSDESGKMAFDDIHYTEVWKQMEELQKEGLTKAIGVSNFNIYQVKKVLAMATIPPAVNQYECHPYLDQEDLLKFCQSKGIVVTGYSNFGSPDRPWAKPGDPTLLEDPKIKAIAAKYNKTPAHVLLRYQLQRGVIVLPKSVNPSRIASNFDVFNFELGKEDMAFLKSLDRNWRAVDLSVLADHPYYPHRENYAE